MKFIVATNIVASQPPKRRPTGTPTARAKIASTTALITNKNITFLMSIE